MIRINYGVWSLLPVCVVIILALLTKKALGPLIIGSLIGFIIVSGQDFFSAWLEALYEVMASPTTVWVILLCGLLGSFVNLVEKSGGTLGFSRMMDKLVRHRQSALLVTWLLGLLLFIDNYLNVIATGSAMRSTLDKYRVPREYLAFVINSAGAAICVLVPFSTWSAFMYGELQAVGVMSQGIGIGTYIQVIPFILYAWISILIVPLYSGKLLPRFGAMRQREKEAESTGMTIPKSTVQKVNAAGSGETAPPAQAHILDFILPMLVLCVASVYFNDMLTGAIAGIVYCFILYCLRGIGKTFSATSVEGFQGMTLVLGILIAAFLLQKANDALGLTNYVIHGVAPFLDASMLPVVSFVIISLLAFGTGSFWGIAAIAFPIIVPLANSLDAHMLLTCGAIISGTVFGSHSCIYGDAVTLSCASSEIENNDYARCCLPLIGLSYALCVLLFFLLGILL